MDFDAITLFTLQCQSYNEVPLTYDNLLKLYTKNTVYQII